MNCGRDIRPVESFIRGSIRLPKRVYLSLVHHVFLYTLTIPLPQPMIFLIASSTPKWKASDCAGHALTLNRSTTPLTAAEISSLRFSLSVTANQSTQLLGVPFVQEGEVNLIHTYSNYAAISVQVCAISLHHFLRLLAFSERHELHPALYVHGAL
jgi:hypothetical protein